MSGRDTAVVAVVMLCSHGLCTAGAVDGAFEAVDTNGDGCIDLREWLAHGGKSWHNGQDAGGGGGGSGGSEERQEGAVVVSPECAAVLLVLGGTAGTAATSLLMPAFLTTAGFSASGPLAGTFASWWSTTTPLVKSASLFATLQSVTIRGTSTQVEGFSELGGAAGAGYVHKLCNEVDSVDPRTAMGGTFTTSLNVVRGMWVGQVHAKRVFEEAVDAGIASGLEGTRQATRLIQDTMEVAADGIEKNKKLYRVIMDGLGRTYDASKDALLDATTIRAASAKVLDNAAGAAAAAQDTIQAGFEAMAADRGSGARAAGTAAERAEELYETTKSRVGEAGRALAHWVKGLG